MDTIGRRQLLDLVRNLRAAAGRLQTVADTMADEGDFQAEAPAEKAIRLEDIRAVLAAKSRDGYGTQVRELLKRHGADRLSQIELRFYKELLREAEVFGNAT